MMTVSGLLGILIGLGLLILFAFRGWSVLLLAPLAALIAALFSREPLLAHWTQTFMASAAGFLAQFFPLFLLGALFGKLMEDSGSVAAIEAASGASSSTLQPLKANAISRPSPIRMPRSPDTVVISAFREQGVEIGCGALSDILAVGCEERVGALAAFFF